MPVGDIHSKEPGTGARYNDGKPEVGLIPLCTLAAILNAPRDAYPAPPMYFLGRFQETGEASYLYDAFHNLAMGNVENFARHVARVFEYGRNKYAAWNWAKGMKWSIPVSCAARHLLEMSEGHTTDAESGLLHAAHVGCNLIMLMHFVETYPDLNDLPSPELFPKRDV